MVTRRAAARHRGETVGRHPVATPGDDRQGEPIEGTTPIIRSTRFAALVAAAALGLAFATPASAALTDNALTDNALTGNGLGSNGLGSNGLGNNGLGSNALTANAAAHRAPAGLVAITLPSGLILSR
jgi:hypothetical protein